MNGLKLEQKTQTQLREKSLGFYQRLVITLFKKMKAGRLILVLPDGQQFTFGDGKGPYKATIKVLNNDFFRKCVLFGDIGFGESYVDGDWETENIKAVIEWMIHNLENHPTMMDEKKKWQPVNFLKILNNVYQKLRPNTLKGSRKNISEHYDLSNKMFELFLDPSMTYSSGIFEREDVSLKESQDRKYEELARKLRIKETDHVLEIGSGWGGNAIYIAKNFGAKVTTVTISQEQYDFAKRRIQEEGLTNKIDIRLCDYRNLQGKFDKIVSIEMIEAVGHKFLPGFIKKCNDLLKKDGMLGLQMIMCPDHRYESFRKNTDWIQKYIFPGSLLPSFSRVQKLINQVGTLNLYDYRDLTDDYVRTLMAWKDNFNANLDGLRALDFSEKFIRKWNYYFDYCAGAFKMRNIKVAQVVFSGPNNPRLINNAI